MVTFRHAGRARSKGAPPADAGVSTDPGYWQTFDFGASLIGGNSSGGSILDDRANALAQAIEKTHVQSLANPCTPAAWYLASGAIAGGIVAAPGAFAAASSNYPTLIHGGLGWLVGNKYVPQFAIAINAAKGTTIAVGKEVSKVCGSLQ